jgi:hypothetical protein
MRRKSLSLLPGVRRFYAAISTNDRMYKPPFSLRRASLSAGTNSAFGRKSFELVEMSWDGGSHRQESSDLQNGGSSSCLAVWIDSPSSAGLNCLSCCAPDCYRGDNRLVERQARCGPSLYGRQGRIATPRLDVGRR